MKRICCLVVLACAPALAYPHGGEDHGEEKKPAARAMAAPSAVAPASPSSVASNEAAQRLSDGSLFVPKAVQRSLGILTAAVQAGDFARTLEMPGRVVADPNAGGRVQAAQSGTIEAGPQGLAVLGQRVRKGQVLATLRPTLNAAERADKQAGLAELEAQSTVMEQRLARLTQLAGSVPKKDIEQTRIELASLAARRKAIAGALGGRIPLLAPLAGVVASSQVVVGQVVEAKEILFEIVDPQRLAVEALAFTALPGGLGRASARLEGPAERTIKLQFIGAGRSLREQALPVMFRIQPEDGGELPPVAIGQTLKVLAETPEKQAGVAMPAAALVRNGANELMVWVHERAERFVPRRVRTAPLDGQRVLVLAGLEDKERVVIQGAQALAQVR